LKKNLVIIGINYYPEDSAIGLFSTQKAEYLTQNGYNVSVIAGYPYYPQWRIWKDYRRKGWYFKEQIKGVTIFRFKQYVPTNPTFFKRILHVISFTLGNLFNLFRLSKQDVVIAIVPFTTSILLAWFLKLRYRGKIWVHIQDFEFDAAIDSGLFNNKKPIIIKLLLWIERSLLKKADVVSTISYGMMNKLQQKANVKSYYLTNWIDIKLFEFEQKETHKYLNSGKFKILYSGNIGAKQDWDLFFKFLMAIEKLKNIEVVIVGEGAEKESILNEIKKHKFVKHYNLVPFEELPLLLSSADLHILFQKSDVIDTVMPSKLLGMMASAKPSIVTGNMKSEIKKIIDKSQGGYYFDGSSVKEIVSCVVQLMNNKNTSSNLGQSAKKFVFKEYSKEKVLNKFIKELEKL